MMAVLLDPNRLATAAALLAAALLALLTRFTNPGAALRWPIVVLAIRTAKGVRYHHAGGVHCAAWLDAHDVPLDDRDGRADPPAPTSAMVTIPDGPFAARTF